jgi:hypothetical protein
VNVTFHHRVKPEDLTFLTPFPEPVRFTDRVPDAEGPSNAHTQGA